MPPLPWMDSKVVKESDDWGFASMVQTGLSSLKESASGLMQPVGQQMGALLSSGEPRVESGEQDPLATRDSQLATPMPEVKPFELPDMNAWGMGEPEPQTPKPRGQTVSFTLPPAEAWGMDAPSSERRVTSGETGPLATRHSSLPAPQEFNAYVRQASAQRGLDPDQVLKVVGKEGPTGWGSVGTFNTGTSYGPLQLHYAGGSQPTAGMGDDFTKATGLDLRKVDPNTPEGIAAHQRAVDFALDRLSKTGDYREWYGADPALGSRMTKVKRIDPVQPMPMPTAGQQAPQPSQPAGAPAYGTYTAESLTPNQFSEGQAQGLSAAEAMAVCGPAAAVAFARANGRNPTLREAKELGSQMGVWDAGSGMHGPASQVQLLEKMGVPARLVGGADEAAIAREIQSGRPVTIDTPGHYYVATGYDPQTRTFEFGNSAGVLKSSKGRTRYRLDELAGLGMGAPRSTIFMGGALT